MFRFACFFSPGHNQRPKKVQHLRGTMHPNSQRNSQEQAARVLSGSNPKTDDNNLSNKTVEQITSPSTNEDCWKSEDLNGDFCQGDGKEFLQMSSMKRSQSLGDILVNERGSSCGDATDDDEIVQGYPFDYFHDSTKRVNKSFNDNDSAESELYDHRNLKTNFHNNHQEHDLVVSSFDFNTDHVHHESLFSIEALKQFDGEQHVSIDEHSAEDVGSPNVLGPHSKSFENLHAYNMPEASDADRKGSHYHADPGEEGLLLLTDGGLIEGQDSEGKYLREIFKGDNKLIDGYASGNSNGILNKRRDELDGVKVNKSPQQESTVHNLDELSPKKFNIRRIEEWISQIDTENGCIVEEPGESSASFSNIESEKEADVPPMKPDAKNNFGVEVAHNYISSLTSTSSSVQMVNLGLVAVPLLSAFSSLRVINLSSNAIVRIPAGALPRGLHILNLSKNSIAAIEGLRDLTRLRVLDLSYNRIVRIGHGLASCSSLKELYLAGNKISEVEGLHRLLKLNILDLRSNKISTAKGLGQLAANYGSLQAINLEGNPAQRNVGDEQLRKYVIGLLPNLVYYNKQTIKTSGSKEISDRTARAIVAPQFDRSTRAEHKLPRKGSYGSGLHKASLAHVRSSHAMASLMKQSKSRITENRPAHLPPMGSKPTNQLPVGEKKTVSLHPNKPIRRVQSEGTL